MTARENFFKKIILVVKCFYVYLYNLNFWNFQIRFLARELQIYEIWLYVDYIWAVTCDFQQCSILTSVDSDEPVKPPFQ